VAGGNHADHSVVLSFLLPLRRQTVNPLGQANHRATHPLNRRTPRSPRRTRPPRKLPRDSRRRWPHTWSRSILPTTTDTVCWRTHQTHRTTIAWSWGSTRWSWRMARCCQWFGWQVDVLPGRRDGHAVDL